MAIYSAVPPPSQAPVVTPAVDVEAWTVSALDSLAISPSARGTGVALSIRLDEERRDEGVKKVLRTRKEMSGRDSLRNREALLRGKEGSRRRQRWENDHLLHVPNAQPPLPSDWEVHPTYPVHSVPYYLAPLWESGIRHRAEESASLKQASRSHTHSDRIADGQKGRVPQELRQKLKKRRGAKSLLQDLEEEVRRFVGEWEREMRGEEEGEVHGEMDSEDEEIVFVGRNGSMSDEQRKTVEEELEREKLVFDSLADDHGASFGRWLVHSIALYYGLSSRSITVGNPARREAYVGIKQLRTGRRVSAVKEELPRPLWGMI